MKIHVTRKALWGEVESTEVTEWVATDELDPRARNVPGQDGLWRLENVYGAFIDMNIFQSELGLGLIPPDASKYWAYFNFPLNPGFKLLY